MSYDTAGNKIWEYARCPDRCHSSGGCPVCRPKFIEYPCPPDPYSLTPEEETAFYKKVMKTNIL